MPQSVGLIFDLDGTLVDSLGDIRAALNHGLMRCNQPTATANAVRKWVGGGLSMLCRRACPSADEATISLIEKTAYSYYREHVADESRPYDNILEMLHLMHRGGVHMAVLTNKPHALALEVVRRLDLQQFFTIVQGYLNEEDKKPSPRAAVNIMGSFGLPAHQVFIVGDSLIDLETARHAGSPFIGVTWGYQSRDQLASGGAECLVDDPLDIPKLSKICAALENFES